MLFRPLPRARSFALLLPFIAGALQAGAAEAPRRDGYAIVLSESTAADPAWRAVAEALEEKYPHAVRVRVPDGDPGAATGRLRELRPRYACFVARHAEVSREFVSRVHQLSRSLDDDPYADVLWGILTGYDAANARQIAATSAPLRIERVASGTEVALEKCREGVWFCELQKNRMVRKEAGAEAAPGKGPDDTTGALAATLNDYRAQLFVTSGHATERDWQIGFRYRNGYFKSARGELFGLDTAGEKIPIVSPEPKVYMPIGNCLMGHIDGPDAMALAWMNRAGVRQMLGYTVPTWYGYAGWGCLDYFVEQPGRYSFTEAFFANQHALIHRLETCFPGLARRPLAEPGEARQMRGSIKATARAKDLGLGAMDAVGLVFDRDAVAFYGDPAWEARMAPGELAYRQSLDTAADEWVFTVEPAGAAGFAPVNTNGSQRGWRPIVQFFERRIDPAGVEVTEGADLDPVITDDFLLVPNPREVEPGRRYRVAFRVGRED